jgi:hypothetical protein
MAITRANNVIILAANADTLSENVKVRGIKLVGGAGGATVNLKKTNNSGVIAYTSTVGNSAEKYEEVNLEVHGAPLYLNVSAGSGTVYLYLE